ncbi:MAG: ABC transporter substrate-binding protein [Deltaproteobacteria bacterium]|nr:MAG: ABC transporter substrate-binding protein [Deltaproteobacteria bacterium]
MIAVSCGSPNRFPPLNKTPSDTLVVGVESASSFSKISRLIHRGLFRVNERFELVPDLIDSFEQPDLQHYIFHLKSGVLFHDGQNLTLDDVVYTLEKNRTEQSPWKKVLDKIDEIKIIDPQTFQISLKEPYMPFLASLTVGIVPKGRSPQIGTGNFAVEKVEADKVRLRRVARSESENHPPVSFLEFQVIPDDDLRLLALKNGRVDVLQNHIPPKLINTLRVEPFKIQTTDGSLVTYLSLNLEEIHLSKPDVRKAIAYALDIPAIIDEHLGGLAVPAQSLLPVAHWAFQSDVSTYPHTDQNLTASKVLLNRLGYFDADGDGPRPRFSLSLKTLAEKNSMGLARLIAKQLRVVGIDLKMVALEKELFLKDVLSGNFDLVLMEGPEEGADLSEPDFSKIFIILMGRVRMTRVMRR